METTLRFPKPASEVNCVSGARMVTVWTRTGVFLASSSSRGWITWSDDRGLDLSAGSVTIPDGIAGACFGDTES